MVEQPRSHDKEWVGPVDSWRTVDARLITYDHFGHIGVRGEVLIGPNEIGGEALFPPNVPSLTPATEDTHNDRKFWRFGTWKSHDPYSIYNLQSEGYQIKSTDNNIVWVTGEEQPKTLVRISSISELAAIALTPDKNQIIEDFIKRHVAQIGALAWRALTFKPGKQNEINILKDLTELQMDAAKAFGDAWVKEELVYRPHTKSSQPQDAASPDQQHQL